jgi:hypothetical protein
MGSTDPDTGERYGLPWEFWRWQIAERFGWTLDTVDALSMGDLGEWFQIEDARAKEYQARHPKK